MDPDANLREQETCCQALRALELPEERAGWAVRLRELRDALDTWLFNGGFAPDWNACPCAASHYRHRQGAGARR